MIESITIASVATYGANPQVLTGLSNFNFIFGSNGTGKTTISRIIADASHYPTCGVQWKSGMPLQTMVYNQNFVERNFNQLNELKGVFTLGEQQVDTLAKIAETKKEIDTLTNKIKSLTITLQGDDATAGKNAELATLEANFKEKCWSQKQKHDAKLQGGFEGYRGSSEKFKAKVLQEFLSNTSTLLPLSELEKKAENLFGTNPTAENLISSIETSTLPTHETHPILTKRVIGKEDVDIAAMIKKLGNSDWVREGRSFYDANENVCPFCQQATTDAFAHNLDEYFGEVFVSDSKAIDDLITNYTTDASRLQQQLAAIIATPSKFIDIEKLKSEKELLDSKILINQQRLADKKKEASRTIALESLSNVFATLNALIESANKLIAEHNQTVANLSYERNALKAQIWKFVLEQLKPDLSSYQKEHTNLNNAIASMSKQIQDREAEKRQKSSELRELEKQTTSVQPTIDGINGLLSTFGFQGFQLAIATTPNCYKLVRADGKDAKATLSEGEKTFVTFLYFYHLLKGSNSDSGITTDRVVVFDDPVSSLDSDILFIVSSLIKGLFDEIRNKTGHIKQIFVLTHNVYFHKEITFNPKRGGKNAKKDEALKDETFWTVRKIDTGTKLEKHESNPITTSYDLLWAEVRRDDKPSLTIQNTLRRILENYFKILGGVDPDGICELFHGKEKLICKSLFSWVNDGSHFAHDDLYVSIDDSQIEIYLNVFKEIFNKKGHLSHYEMMMGRV